MRKSTNSLPADERRLATVETVIALAGSTNPGDITTTAIAAEMGLTQGALFRHFPTKDSIIEAVIEWVVEHLMARVDTAAGSASAPLAALEAVFLAHIDFVARHPGVPRIVFGQLQHAGQTAAKGMVQAMLRRYGQRVAALLADARDRGEVDAALDVEAATTLFIGTIQGLVMQSLLHGDVRQILSDAPRVFQIYRRGIATAR
ncbi:MAG: TetR/AcrR family transcriptional regulator [Gemmatimonadaceae bacterium]|nr:TetR/AcrR family transcriptional regulator [Gemmatimonadaceae bacterium]